MSTFPLAVQPSIKTPGFYLLVNLLAGQASSAAATKKALIIAPKSSAGSITAQTGLTRSVNGPDEARTLLGPGTPGHLCAAALFKAHPTAKVDIIAPTASAGVAATGTIVLGGAPTSNMTIRFFVKGETYDLPWNVGTSVTVAGEALELLLNAGSDRNPATFDNVAGTVTGTAKIAGVSGNDILMAYEILEGAGGTVTITAIGGVVAGTLEPVFTTVLANIAAEDYDFIIPCVSNAEAQSASATSNPGRVKTHIDTYDSGISAKLQQAIVGVTGAKASAVTGVVGRNFPPMQYVYCMAGMSLGCEFAGWEAGRRMVEEVSDPAVNRIGDPISATLYGAYDLTADKPTDVEIEDALNQGLSIVNYDAQNNLYLVAPITTYSQDSSGNPDGRAYYVSGVSGAYAFAKDLRTRLRAEYAGAKITADLTPDDEPAPNGVVEIRDIRASVVDIGRDWIRRGVLKRAEFEAAVTSGDLVVRINPDDGSQVDIVVPVSILAPLAKISGVVLRKG